MMMMDQSHTWHRALGAFVSVVLRLGSGASGLLLLPWSYWWIEASGVLVEIQNQLQNMNTHHLSHFSTHQLDVRTYSTTAMTKFFKCTFWVFSFS